MQPNAKTTKGEIEIQNTNLTANKSFTYLTADTNNTKTTLEVQSVVRFALDNPIVLGEIGQEDTELVRVHASTSPAAGTITLAAAPSFSHTQDTKVTKVLFDAIEIDWASTASGGKQELATLEIDVGQKQTYYTDTSQTSGFYFVRFYDTNGGTVAANLSDWSDAIPYAGYSDNTVFAIKERALNDLDEEINKKITHAYLNQSLWEARREYHKAPGKRPFRRKYNVDIGNVATGSYRVLAPSDLEKPETDENVYGVRIGTQPNLTKYSKKEFDDDYRNIPHTTLAEDYTVGNTYVSVADARDFATTGDINIAGDSIGYSARDLSTGSLTVSSAGDVSHTTGDDVWQNVSFGLPTKFVVFVDSSGSSYVYFNRPIDTLYVDQNIYMDYYRTLVAYDSDADELDEPEFDFYTSYLRWKIKKKKQPDLKAQNDDDFTLWLARKNEILAKERLDAPVYFRPDIDHLL